MKVLFVCPFVPWPLDNGGKTRTFHLLRAAGTRVEIHLHLIEAPGQSEGPELEAELRARFTPQCASLRLHPRSPIGLGTRLAQPKLERWFHSDSLRTALEQDLREGTFDLVHLDELLLARVLPQPPGVPVVQHHHKLDTVLYDVVASDSSPLNRLERAFDLFKLRRLERESTRRTRHHLLCSQEDADLLTGRHGALDTGSVASGFDPDVFRPDESVERSPGNLLFLGSMDYAPNVEGLLWFAHEILPRIRSVRPDVVLDVIGGNPTAEVRALACGEIKIHGRADSVVPWLARSAAMVVPLKIGGGTRLKIAEALGAQTPTISTTIGAEGLGLVDGRHVLLADEAESFAQGTLQLLADPEEARLLALRGSEHALAHYTWEALGSRLVDYWARVVRAERAESAARC